MGHQEVGTASQEHTLDGKSRGTASGYEPPAIAESTEVKALLTGPGGGGGGFPSLITS